MQIEGLFAEFVAVQSLAALGRGNVRGAGRRVADAENGPLSLRHVPRKETVRSEFRR